MYSKDNGKNLIGTGVYVELEGGSPTSTDFQCWSRFLSSLRYKAREAGPEGSRKHRVGWGWLGEGLAAVGEEVLAGDVGGGVADEEGDGGGVVGGVGEAAEGDADAVALKAALEEASPAHLVVVGCP